MSETNAEKLQRIKAESETLWRVSPNFRWLIEQAEKVEELEKKIDIAIDELGYAWRTGNDGLKDEYIKNAIRFLEEE